MDYLHRGFTHPGGVSPMKQEEQEVTKNPKSKQEEAIDPNIVKFVNQYGPKTDESGMRGKTELRQGPDMNQRIVNAVVRFIAPQNTLEAGLAVLPFGIGKHPGIRKLASKIFGGGTGKVIKGGVDKTTKKGFDFAKTSKTTGKVSDDAIKKMNANIDRYGQPNPTLYPKVANQAEFNKVVGNATKGTAEVGKNIASNLEEATKVIKSLDPKKSIKKLGVTSGKHPRTIYEVTYPNGQKLRYWESSGSGGKSVEYSQRNSHLNAKNSKGHFGVLPGNMDASKVGRSKSWYIKTDGWERGYGSDVIEETGIWLKSLNDSKLLP